MDDASAVFDEDTLHSQIREQLDCLNTTSEKINQLENELNSKRSQFRKLLLESSRELNLLSQRLGDCVDQARPYYESRRHAKEAQYLTQQAALKYDRAVSVHAAAREMVMVTENGIKHNSTSSVWFEMLNRANEKVVKAEMEQFRLEAIHQKRAVEFKVSEDRVHKFKNLLRSSIKRSRPYYEKKLENQECLQKLSVSIKNISKELHKHKLAYSKALKNLESISNALHSLRQENRVPEEHLKTETQDNTELSRASDEEDSHFKKLHLSIGSEFTDVVKDLQYVDSLDHIESLTCTSNQDDFSVSSQDSNDTVFSEAKVALDVDELQASKYKPHTLHLNSTLPSTSRSSKNDELIIDAKSMARILGDKDPMKTSSDMWSNNSDFDFNSVSEIFHKEMTSKDDSVKKNKNLFSVESRHSSNSNLSKKESANRVKVRTEVLQENSRPSLDIASSAIETPIKFPNVNLDKMEANSSRNNLFKPTSSHSFTPFTLNVEKKAHNNDKHSRI